LALAGVALLVDQPQSPLKAATLYSALLLQRAAVKAVRLLAVLANTVETAVLAAAVRLKEQIAAVLETRLAHPHPKAATVARRRFLRLRMATVAVAAQARLALLAPALAVAMVALGLPLAFLVHL
jgi:hypothetical protein